MIIMCDNMSQSHDITLYDNTETAFVRIEKYVAFHELNSQVSQTVSSFEHSA